MVFIFCVISSKSCDLVSTRLTDTKAPQLVLLHELHLCDPATRARPAETFLRPSKQHTPEHTVHDGDWKWWTQPLLAYGYLQEIWWFNGSQGPPEPYQINLYLNSRLNHRHFNMLAIPSAPVHFARAVWGCKSHQDKLDKFLKATFRENGYNGFVLHAMEGSSVPGGFKFDVCPVLHPYNLQLQQQDAAEACHACWPGSQQDLWLPVTHEDNTGKKRQDMNSISCKCGQVYTGQTGRSTETRLGEFISAFNNNWKSQQCQSIGSTDNITSNSETQKPFR